MNHQIEEILNAYDSFHPLPIESMSPQAARQQTDLRDASLVVLNHHMTKRLVQGVLEPVDKIEHQLIPSGDQKILIRIYRPAGAGTMPATLYFHGGGMVIASLDTYDSSCRALANAAQCIVVSVAYRQAPENPFPAAPEDAFQAYKWVVDNAESLGIDKNCIAVTGESAGGNLATVVCMLAKERGCQMPVHQLLIYPMLDAAYDTPSYRKNAEAKPLNKAMMQWFWSHYLKSPKDRFNPLACPLQATDLSGLPPATVITAEIDPLCSDGETYADKLESFGVPVFQKRFENVTHEFFSMSGLVPEAKEAVSLAAEKLQDSFNALQGAPVSTKHQAFQNTNPSM